MASRNRAKLSQRSVIYAGLAGNFLVAATKLTAAAFTGSSAMLSEGVHSVVDSGNSILLLYGLHRAAIKPDRQHPLGYGREIYFWSFVVAVLVFALGAGVSFYEGASHILNPEPIQHPWVNYAVLGLSALFDGATWWLALRHFKGRTRFANLFSAVRTSKDPPAFMVLFEDSAALLGLGIAAVGTFLSLQYQFPALDGVASILISLVLAFSAAVLARETKGLLIGEAAEPAIVAAMMQIARGMDGVANANGIMTIHLAPAQIVVWLSLEFADHLRTPEIEAKVAELEGCLRKLHPEVVSVFIKPQSSAGFKAAMASKYGGPAGEAVNGTNRASEALPHITYFRDSQIGDTMAQALNTKAAEHHEAAAKSHRSAAEHHGKSDHPAAKDMAKKAVAQSSDAHAASTAAQVKSAAMPAAK